ncbi:hypothetical protein GCM10022252_39820 [Streptosporangium oxazolinicum]|uniref:Uncharacterized protein n=1 Tax=Streptosporangium oxazolinicum TaxID=909287 RepID=A0ABP8B0R9_9ACTN
MGWWLMTLHGLVRWQTLGVLAYPGMTRACQAVAGGCWRGLLPVFTGHSPYLTPARAPVKTTQ